MGTIHNGLQRIVDDETGVSPVIGVILMVAVTVIVAAVIGSSALGVADEVSETPPKAQFEMEMIEEAEIARATRSGETRVYGNGVMLSHGGGEDVNVENIEVTVNGKPVYSYGTYDGGDHSQVTYPFQEVSGDDIRRYSEEISAGDETTLVWYGSYVEENGYTIDPQTDTKGDGGTLDYATWYDDDDEDLFWDGNQIGYPPLDGYNGDFEGGDTIRVVWQSDSSSQVLFEEEV